MKLSYAIERLQKALKEDDDYFYGWQANIAVAYQDEAARNKSRDSVKFIHETSNQAAKNFLNLLLSDVAVNEN